ncbi:MAG: HEAT repeat domain-containing protein, partial [Cyanobacteria bacterium P01_F01_bin.153]
MGVEAEQSLALLEKLASDHQAEVRVAALETLADAQIPDTIPVLEKALRDANPAVVRVASR